MVSLHHFHPLCLVSPFVAIYNLRHAIGVRSLTSPSKTSPAAFLRWTLISPVPLFLFRFSADRSLEIFPAPRQLLVPIALGVFVQDD